MERRTPSAPLTWLLLPVVAYLAQSALGLSGRAYTGLALRGDLVASVDRGSPGQRAGLVAGDRVSGTAARLGSDPLAAAVAGRPLTLLRQRGATVRPAWLVPQPLPANERRLNAMLLVVASV